MLQSPKHLRALMSLQILNQCFIFLNSKSLQNMHWCVSNYPCHALAYDAPASDVLNKKALGTIHMFLAVSMDFNISKEKTMEDLMKELTKLYEKPSTSNKLFLMKCLFNMKMLEGGSIVDNFFDCGEWGKTKGERKDIRESWEV
jgi:hypothetical protein